MRFAQVSDIHLVPRGLELHGLDPAKRLKECIADINTLAESLDFCVITGDLCDQGDPESYKLLRKLLF